MKRVFFLFSLCISITAFSQKIKTNHYDKFLKQKVIETSATTLKPGLNTAMSLSFRCEGEKLLVLLKGFGQGASAIGSDDPAILLLDNDSTITLKPTGFQSYEVTSNKNTYKHEYVISLNDLEQLSQHGVQSIRKHSTSSYVDFDIPAKNKTESKKLSSLFLNTLTTESLVSANRIKLDEVQAHVGDSVTICGRVYSPRYLQNASRKPTFLNIGAAYPNQAITVVIYDTDRATFGGTPEELYSDKEVCVSGKIEMYNGRPQMVITKKEQLKIMEAVTAKTF